MEEGTLIVAALSAIRLVGVGVCVNKAETLNRSQFGWGFFGFISPIIAMIWIHNIKSIVKFEEDH